MRAGQPVKAGAIDVKLFQNGDPARLGGQERGLGSNDVVVSKTTAREAFPHQNDGALRLGQGLGGDALGLECSRSEKHLEPRDFTLAFFPERRKVGFSRNTFEPGAFDSGLVPVVAPQGYGPAHNKPHVLTLPEMADAHANRCVRGGARLFQTNPGEGNIALRGENREVDLGGSSSHFPGRAGILEIGRVQGKVRGADPEATQRGAGQSGLYAGLIEVDLGLRQLRLGARTGEQGVARHVHAPLHFCLEAFGQSEPLASDLKFGLGGKGLGPGALDLLKPVKSPDCGFRLNYGRLALCQGDTRRPIAAAFKPLFV